MSHKCHYLLYSCLFEMAVQRFNDSSFWQQCPTTRSKVKVNQQNEKNFTPTPITVPSNSFFPGTDFSKRQKGGGDHGVGGVMIQLEKSETTWQTNKSDRKDLFKSQSEVQGHEER